MDSTPNNGQQAPSLFSQLIIMFATSTLQQMGKLVNPMTQKTEVNLEAAEATIDLLDMLQEKTKGNLDSSEEHMLSDTLTSLKLNFVECKKDQAASANDSAPSSPEPEPAKPEPAETEPATAEEEKESDGKRKYHKKYD